MIRALRLVDREISNGRKAKSHQIIIVELPILIAVRAKPVSRIVMRFVSKAHGNAIFVVSPKLLNQSIIEFFRPLAGQKFNNLLDHLETRCDFSSESRVCKPVLLFWIA
jgi:hypothetical protein